MADEPFWPLPFLIIDWTHFQDCRRALQLIFMRRISMQMYTRPTSRPAMRYLCGSALSITELHFRERKKSVESAPRCPSFLVCNCAQGLHLTSFFVCGEIGSPCFLKWAIRKINYPYRKYVCTWLDTMRNFWMHTKLQLVNCKSSDATFPLRGKCVSAQR